MRSPFFLTRLVGLVVAAAAGSALAQGNPEPTPHQDPTGNTGALKAQVDTGCGYDARTGNGTRSVTDLKVPGALGDYGLDFTRYWNSLPAGDSPTMPAAMPFWDFGVSGWTHSWGWTALEEHHYPEELPGSNNDNNLWITSITITFPDGHTTTYKITRLGHGQWPIANGDPRHGPPYLPHERDWPMAGAGVHDHLCGMAPDGSTFWLHRADGSSVLFGGGPDGYVAYEIYDPHGFKTTLEYNENWQLTKVSQEGGRWLTLTWGYAINGGVAAVISRVETGGYAAGQAVNYHYAVAGAYLTLARVEYTEGDDAFYTYQGPRLTVASDPRFAGPMKRIRYTYRGERCRRPDHPPDNTGYEHFLYYYAQPEAIDAERSFKTDAMVSRLGIQCFTGKRKEHNGLGGWRMFYYGHSATWDGSGARGYELAKVTDFYIGVEGEPGVPAKRQSHSNGHPCRIWDGRELQTQLAHQDSSGQPSEVKHLSDGNKTYLYNRINTEGSDSVDPDRIRNPYSRWLFSQTDERGLKTIYRRDLRRRVKEIIYPAGAGTEHFTYNVMNQVETHTLASGAVQTYVYDGLNRLEREYNSVDGPSAAKIYTYDELGRVRTVSDCRSRAAGVDFSTKMTYNGRHQVTQVEYAGMENNSGNAKVQYGYDGTGNCTSITNELGQTSTYKYDDYRRCTEYTEPLNASGWDGTGTVANRTWTWIYDRVIDGGPQGDSTVHTSREWRVQIEPAHNAAGDRRMTARTFDLNNRISREQTGWIQPAGPIGSTNPWYWSAEGETHHFTYDENGQKKTFIDPMGRETSYEYDNRNRLWKTNETINSVPRTTETLYDGTGNKVQVIFPDGKTQQWLYHDAFGQPRQFIDERGSITHLDYWPWGPMKKLAQVTTYRDGPGTEQQLTAFFPDGMGRLRRTNFPDGSFEQTDYECGQLKTFKTRKGQIKTITGYDARGREESHLWSDGTPGITRLWDAAGRLLWISNVYSLIEYQCDAAGQVAYEWNTIKGSLGSLGKSVKVQTRYLRYPNGEVSRLQYPNGVWVQREYTARGQLKTVSDTLGGGAEVQSAVTYSYHLDGKVDSQNYGNGVLSDLGYDPRGFISDVVHWRGSTNLMQRNYHRDQRDRITSWQKGSNPGNNPRENGRGDRYVYDDEGQLTDAWYNAADPHGNFNGWERKDYFNYDAMGNRKDWNDIANRGPMRMQRRDNNGLNQYHSWENNLTAMQHWGSATPYDDNFNADWVYPGNGVMMGDGFIVASYNALNQPVAMWSFAYEETPPKYVWFGHDPLGRCVKRAVGPVTAQGTAPPPNTNPATYFYYDGWNLIQEGLSATSTQRVYVHGGRVDEIVHSKNYLTSQRAYHQYDARGHCTLLTDTAGQILRAIRV